MISYATVTGTHRNLQALREYGWRLLLCPGGSLNNHGFRYGLDNGAWRYYQRGVPFDHEAFAETLSAVGRDADFVVVPDVVGDGKASLRMTEQWLPRLEHLRLRLVAVQDGMVEDDVAGWLGAGTGIFLGGTTRWKLDSMQRWGEVAGRVGCHYHVGRVNTARRIYACAAAGAHSFDGTSASVFAVNVPHLSRALDFSDRQGSLGW